MTAIKLLKLESFDSNESSHEHIKYSEQDSFQSAQHRQPDSPTSAAQANANQDQTQPNPLGEKSTADFASPVKQVRRKQQVDLAMLRLSFRKLILPEDQQDTFDEKHTAHPVRNFSCSEFSNLVSAVTRLHNDERETFGIKSPDTDNQNNQTELQELEALSFNELLLLCKQEGISPPDSCQTPNEEIDHTGISQT